MSGCGDDEKQKGGCHDSRLFAFHHHHILTL